MKKILSTIVLGVFLVGLLVPVLVSAQPAKPADCCVLKVSITKIKSGLVRNLGNAPAGGKCIDGGVDLPAGSPPTYEKQCTAVNPCSFQKGCAIAETGGATDKCKSIALGGIANSWGVVCLINTIYNVTDWIFYLMLIATVILVVIGGAMYMMSAGDAEKAGKGKSIIIYGIIGLGIAVFARAVPSIVKLILSV